MNAIVIDYKQLKIVGTYKTIFAARRAVDRKDNAYDAYKHQAHSVIPGTCSRCGNEELLLMSDICPDCYIKYKKEDRAYSNNPLLNI